MSERWSFTLSLLPQVTLEHRKHKGGKNPHTVDSDLLGLLQSSLMRALGQGLMKANLITLFAKSKEMQI